MWPNRYWGRYWGDIYWPPHGVVVVIDPNFRLFVKDSEVRVKGWGSNGPYNVSSPFGGPTHEEPSGAEI